MSRSGSFPLAQGKAFSSLICPVIGARRTAVVIADLELYPSTLLAETPRPIPPPSAGARLLLPVRVSAGRRRFSDPDGRGVVQWNTGRSSRSSCLHAGLLSAMAHASEPRPDAVRRAPSGRPRRSAARRWPRQSPHRRRTARPLANALTRQKANHSRCTASTPCSTISPRSPAMSSASGAIASPPSSPPYPHTAPRPRSARPDAHCVDRPTPVLRTNSITALKTG